MVDTAVKYFLVLQERDMLIPCLFIWYQFAEI